MAGLTACWNVVAAIGAASAAAQASCSSRMSPSWWRPARTRGTSDAGIRSGRMSERTGLGVVEIALLEALDTSRFLKCDKALWSVEARVAQAGRAALAAERGETAALPIAIINGNTYREGLRPPFRPQAIIDAVREAVKRPSVTDAELTDMVGPPYFMTGCTVAGDLPALAAGHRTELSLRARVSISDDRRTVVIGNIPPNISTDDTASIIASRASASRWANDHPGLHRIAHLPLA